MIGFANNKKSDYLDKHTKDEYNSEGDNKRGFFAGKMSIRDGSYGTNTTTESLHKMMGDDEKNQGIELTPAPPKDWTILENRATDEERKVFDKIWRDAIFNTVDAIENNTYYRKTVNGKTTYVRAEGIKVAIYDHHTARSVGDVPDCHKHSHIVISPLCMGKDGKLYKHTLKELPTEKGGDATKLQETLHYFDQVFQSELAKGLQNKFNLQIENDGKDNFKVNGLTDEIRKAFSQRSEDINAAAGENASSYAKQKIAITRRNKKHSYDLNELRGIWQEKMSSLGLEKISDLPKGQIEQSRDFKEVFKDVRFISEKLIKIYALSESKYSTKSSEQILKEFKESGLLKEFRKGNYINLSHKGGKEFERNFAKGSLNKMAGGVGKSYRQKSNKTSEVKLKNSEEMLQELEREHQNKIVELTSSKRNSLDKLSQETASYEEKKNNLIQQIAAEKEKEIDMDFDL